ncbi:MAG: hypothetical protein ACRCWF_18780 [Beijerinckiaceae bacterium]
MRTTAKGLLLAALASVVITGSATSSQAQWFTYRPPVIMDEMTPREIVHSIRSQGFRNPSHPQYRDDLVVVSATEPSGRRVRLLLDVYSGRIVDIRPLAHRSVQERREAPRPREQVVQRVPDQGAAIRRSVPDSEQRARVTPERPTIIRREPMLPAPQQKVTPEAQTPAKAPPQATVGSGTRTEPRRIDMVPPAGLDSAPAAPKPLPAPAPIIPPAALE